MTSLRIALPLAAVTVLTATFAFSQTPTLSFTAEQATRGEAAYAANCTGCHGPALLGGGAPALSGEEFQAEWGAKTVGELFAHASERMPRTAPGSLPLETYADLIAYILQFNGIVAGETELPTDPENAAVPVFPAS